jgi:hypothetical protein
MRLALLSLATTFGLASFGNNAHAQQKTQTIIFEPSEVEGSLKGPSGDRITGNNIRAIFNPLVHIRTEFNQEMQQSIDQIK